MSRKLFLAVYLLVTLALAPFAFAETENCAPGAAQDANKCGPDGDPQTLFSAAPALAGKPGNLLAATIVPKVVFQINQAADAPNILRYVTNYLIAEPSAEVVVVGYAGGIDFMLKGAKDAEGKPYLSQLQALTEKGVHFKVCGNTLKGRKSAPDTVVSQAVVVPSAVNEIIRLQTREGYAYFRH
jgi:uncharacterized protein